MHRILVPALIALIFVVGCSKKPGNELATSDPAANHVESPPSRTAPKPGTPPAVKPEDNPGPAKLPVNVPEPNPSHFEIPSTGTGQWKSTKMKANDLARKIATSMNGLRATEGKNVTEIVTPAEHGMVESKIKVQDPKHFSIQFPVVRAEPEQVQYVADGSQKAFRGPKGAIEFQKPLASHGPDAGLSKGDLAKNWPTAFPRLLFRGLIEGQDPWEPLFEALASPRSGFKTEIAERVLPYQGRQVKDYRLTAQRTPEAAKSLGNCDIEMIFDDLHGLPVTIRVIRKDPKEGVYKVNWSTGWKFKRTFKPEEFKF